MGLSNSSADTCPCGFADDGSLQAAAEESSQHRSAPSADQPLGNYLNPCQSLGYANSIGLEAFLAAVLDKDPNKVEARMVSGCGTADWSG